MRRVTIKARVTLWYALLLLVICVVLLIYLLAAGERAARAYCAETLHSAAVLVMDELEYEHGILEIDDDIDDVPNVYASLYSENGELLYGRRRVDLPFSDGALRRAEGRGHDWYVLDVRLAYDARPDAWLRLATSADVASRAYRGMLRHGFWLFPLLAALALAGGYALTVRAFRPVKLMSRFAASVADGGDLSARIGLQGVRDELHDLSDAFDGMLERLQCAFRREQRFTSDAAHELRTPINAISTQCEYGLSRRTMEEKDEALERILRKNDEMGALVRQLLLMARLDAGQFQRDDDCALDQMCREIADDMRPVAEERNIRLELDAKPCQVRGNRALLARAFVNLTDNAIRYGRPGGRVAIGVEPTPDGARAWVEDDGAGMAREELAMAFERFWRADPSRSAPGTGIGLSIVKSVIDAHGGRICAESEPGSGTKFEIWLKR